MFEKKKVIERRKRSLVLTSPAMLWSERAMSESSWATIASKRSAPPCSRSNWHHMCSLERLRHSPAAYVTTSRSGEARQRRSAPLIPEITGGAGGAGVERWGIIRVCSDGCGGGVGEVAGRLAMVG